MNYHENFPVEVECVERIFFRAPFDLKACLFLLLCLLKCQAFSSSFKVIMGGIWGYM